MPKKLTTEDLLAAKALHGFLWTWVKKFPDKKTNKEQNSRTHLHLKCGSCGEWHWVEWSGLRDGRTRCCWDCTRLPTMEQMQALVIKFDMFWKPSLEFKKDPKTRRRIYLMECKCGKTQWVRWNHFQQGLTRGCKSCTSGLRTHGRSKDPLYVSWRALKKNKRDLVPEWRQFIHFRQWAKPLWAPGWKLVRFDNSQPFGPDNCDYVPINRRNYVPLQESPDTIKLPTGNLSTNRFRESEVEPSPDETEEFHLPHSAQSA